MKPKLNKIRPFDLQIFADCDIITEFLKRNRFPSVQELEKMKPEEFKDAVIEFRYRLYDPNEREQFGYDRTAKEGTIAEFLKRETFLNPNSLERMDAEEFKKAVIAFRELLNDQTERKKFGYDTNYNR